MTNTFSKIEDAPMRFEIEEGVVNCKTIKVSCSDADDNVCKEELPLFTNNSPEELLIQLLEEILAMQERFEWFVDDGDGNNDADTKKKLIFQHFGRALKGMPQRKWAKIIKNHHNYTLNSFRDKAERLISEGLGEEAYEEQYQYLCETKKPRDMKVSDWIDRLEVINERLPLIDRSADKLSERETIRKVISPNIPRAWERDYLLKEGDKAKTLKAVKTILKTIEKAHRNDEVEEEPSSKKKPKEPAHNPTDINKCRLNGHNHLWKNCPNNPISKSYNGTHYSKIREQERAGTTAPRKNEDTSTKSDDESKRPHKRRHRDRERREVSSLNSIDSDASDDSHYVKFSQVRDSAGSAYSSESESDAETQRSWSTSSNGQAY